MKTFLRLILAACLVLLPAFAHAAYNCSITSPGFSAAYVPTAPSTNVTTTDFTITCTRALSDPTTMNWSAGANNGLRPRGGGRNRAAFGRARINYDIYRDAGCGTQWTSGSPFSGTLDFSGSTSASVTVSYWGCIPAGQGGLRAGTYTDLVTMTLTYGPFLATSTGSFPVDIITPATCNLSTPPGNLVFNYTGFGAAANASTTYGVTCTSYLPYTMALDATSGTLLGVNYTLSLPVAGGTGTGLEQSYGINGTIAAGQSGTCGAGTCTASQARTLTITY